MAHGTEDRNGPTQGATLADLFRHEGNRSARLRSYLATSPSGERDVSKDLDRLERQRGTWLRGVLDCCDD